MADVLTGPAVTMRPARSALVLAFGAVYIIWGSTYLAIRYAIATMPPFLMAGARFTLAGALLYAFARRRGDAPPRREHLLPAFLIGTLMLFFGNGGVVLAERSIPSGLAALIVATVPLFVTAIESLLKRRWPSPVSLVALAVGFIAVGILVDPRTLAGGDTSGIVLVLVASLAWAGGSVYAGRSPRPPSGFIAASIQMLSGGAVQLLAGTVTGEWSDLHLSSVSLVSLASLGYLVVFGSLVAYTAYAWLIQVCPPSVVATYAYVNPMVAVFLGWLFAAEPITARTLIATAMIVGSVVLITVFTKRSR